ncbi:MAG: hypothetical protein CMC96_11540 [Flavobacteriales bacterium]|nr:hypothetical protein [Flavobacteriales bacterium]|tara:strand:- start:41713 stop:43083 length:1371 start_codon:yes stop_codon:yes gene_type:complete
MNKFFQLTLSLSAIFFSLSCSTSSTVSQSNNSDTSSSYAQETNDQAEYGKDDFVRYEDYVYKENIKTPQLYVKGEPLSMPVLFMNGNKKLELHFDDLDSEFHTYSYKIVHCNANWEPSSLNPQEYISGYFNGFIEDYKYSFNTLFSYIHYKLEFPNQELTFTKSGNYIIKVYANNNEDDLLLTRRFFVVEQRVSIESNIHMATLARHRDYKQEVDFTINTQNYNIQDPYADIQVVLSQNRRWDNAIFNLKPLFVRTPELIYNYEDNNLFDGNNEFRFFDAKDLRYQSMNVDGVQIENGKTHLWVLAEEPRSFKRYYTQQDINGKRLIKRDQSNEQNREADYMLTHFTLKRETPVENADIYVFGELSDWQFKEDFKMEYVEVEKEYRLTTLLKQGYYNYMYATLASGEKEGDLSVIEGTHSETENDYYFFVYHRQRGEIYDRLVGFHQDNSVKELDD